MSECKNFIYVLCNVRKESIQRQKGIKRKTESSDVNRNQENGYFLFRFDLETNNFEQFELNIEVDDGLKLSKTYLPMMKCQKNGNILIFYKFLNAASYKPSQLDPFEVYEIIRDEDGRYSSVILKTSVSFKNIHDSLNWADYIPLIYLDESSSKWLLIDEDAKLALGDANGDIKPLIPTEDSASSFFKDGKYDDETLRIFYNNHGRIYYLNSFGYVEENHGEIEPYHHDLYEIEVFEENSTFRAERIGRIEKMHTNFQEKILVYNQMIISVYKDVCMCGFFQVPKLSELAFIKIQKMKSRKFLAAFENDDCFEPRRVYEGGISEENLKKMIGMDSGKRLLPLIN
uniref:Uncharacterized protein n=1 Tax=Acrobeloides nanus TaxID=290746 RepID=A0A914ENL3_9BILA